MQLWKKASDLETPILLMIYNSNVEDQFGLKLRAERQFLVVNFETPKQLTKGYRELMAEAICKT